MEIKTKEKITTSAGILSSTASFLGGYQVCHNVCLGIIAILSIIGITITGMPLLFLQKVAVPFWTAGTILLLITFVMYKKKKCISKNLIIINSGILVAGIPFKAVEEYAKYFWIIGGLILLAGITLMIKNRRKK